MTDQLIYVVGALIVTNIGTIAAIVWAALKIAYTFGSVMRQIEHHEHRLNRHDKDLKHLHQAGQQ